jgi:hypothetical protein
MLSFTSQQPGGAEHPNAINPIPFSAQNIRIRDSTQHLNQQRPSKKRKSPASTTPATADTHVLPPLVHLQSTQPQQMNQGYPYAPTDYTPGGMPPPHSAQIHPAPEPQSDGGQSSGGGRTLSSSKRAEQNRKAQRAFRERRDQYVRFCPDTPQC